jgi:hypothetical protein
MDILEKYYRINQLAGVGIHLNPDGTASISACSIAASSQQLDIDKKILDLSVIDDLKKSFPAKLPMALNISGKGVLYRKIERVEEIDQRNFNQILPNANPDDFYVQNFVSGNQSFVSIIRKRDADKWVSSINDQDFEILSLSLGPFPVDQITSQLNVYGNDFTFNGNAIYRDEQGNWTDYKYDETALSPFALKVESEGIHEKLLLPYAAAFQLILAGKLETVQANVPSLDNALQRKIGNNKFKVKAFAIISVFFVLLLINFILFSWLNSANSDLISQVSVFTQNTNSQQDINQQIKEKEGVLQGLGWEDGVNKSALVDQLSSLVPNEITLNEISVDPLDINSSRIQKILVFFSRRIRITGFSDKIIPVNEWIARMKTRHWVKDVQIENYVFNNEMNTGEFSITLAY